MTQGARARRVPVSLFLLPAMAFLALIAWALSSPIGSSPDEDYHLASTWCALGERADLCEQGSAPDRRQVPRALIYASKCYAFEPDQSAECVEVARDELLDTNRGNFVGDYPPLFYATMGTLASPDIATSVLLMRALNAGLYVGLITATWLVARRTVRAPLLWGAVIPLVPLGVFLVPSVNPSSWAIIGATILWPAMAAYFEEASGRRRAAAGALSVLAVVMSAGARSDAAVYSGVAMVAVAVLYFERSRRYAMSLMLPTALALIAVTFFLGSGQSAVIDPGTATDSPDANPLRLALLNLVLLPDLWAGALGTWGLGWLDTAMTGIVWAPAIGFYITTVFVGLGTLKVRKAIAVGLVFACLVAVPLYVLVHDQAVVGSYVQPRYIYPLMIMLAGIAVVGFRRPNLGFNGTQLSILAIGLSLAHAAALNIEIRRYVTGLDENGPDLDTGAEWWWDSLPLGPTAVWAIGSIAFALVLAGLALAANRLHPPALAVDPRDVPPTQRS